jgi:hypothetical protein
MHCGLYIHEYLQRDKQTFQCVINTGLVCKLFNETASTVEI